MCQKRGLIFDFPIYEAYNLGTRGPSIIRKACHDHSGDDTSLLFQKDGAKSPEGEDKERGADPEPKRLLLPEADEPGFIKCGSLDLCEI